MRLSIFTTATNPITRGDLVDEAMRCYADLADEVIYVDGSGDLPIGTVLETDKLKELHHKWDGEFSWEFIGQQFQRGYEACTGDWVIHADLDFIFHEKDFAAIRRACIDNNQAPAMSFYKYQFILPDRYNIKSRLVIAVNKAKYGDRIIFNSGGDLCQPSLDGKYLSPDDVPESGIAIYNYDKLLKNETQIKDDVGRMSRAWHTHFGDYKLSGPDDESAYQAWLQMMIGRFNKLSEHIPLADHPKYTQGTIANLTPDQWGYSGLGLLGRNDYA